MNSLDLKTQVDALMRQSPKCSEVLKGLGQTGVHWSTESRERLLDNLAALFVQRDTTKDVVRFFFPISLEIIERAKLSCFQNGDLLFREYKALCVALSLCLSVSKDVMRATVTFLAQHPPFFQPEEIEDPPKKKKHKKSRRDVSDREIAEAAYRMCQYSEVCQLIRNNWNWGSLLNLMNSDDKVTKWCALHSVCKILGMAPVHVTSLNKTYLGTDVCNDLVLKYDMAMQSWEESLNRQCGKYNPSKPPSDQESTINYPTLRASDFSENLACISGILLPKYCDTDASIRKMEDSFVLVPSAERNLRRLALAVSSVSPVLIEGPVGCGKTTLVSYLASRVNRQDSPQLTKIQLGDQTDSKVLIGTYRCTTVPGEFVWQAGPLTRAVMEGHWILLEDLDYAPMDVISILVPLLQSRTLSVPGHGDEIKAANSFRLFASLRKDRNFGGVVDSNVRSILHMWTRVAPELLSREELVTIIQNKYPTLSVIVDRILDIYYMLCEGLQKGQESSNGNIGKGNLKKFISPRDLMKWCDRIAPSFNMTDPATANFVYQEAVDCFCASIPTTSLRLKLAENIGSHLNISSEKAQYYLESYKPVCEVKRDSFSVGRAQLPSCRDVKDTQKPADRYAFTRQTVHLLERLCVCVSRNEPTLLVGETGSGKTTAVQYLAEQCGHRLTVINLSQQSDSTDLLGGYKPVDIRSLLQPIRESFEDLFSRTFSKKQNNKFLGFVQECFLKQKWQKMLQLMKESASSMTKSLKSKDPARKEWRNMKAALSDMDGRLKVAENALAFSFVEGSLTSAVRNGGWVLLDEINLASAETLESLSGLLEGKTGSLTLLERGDSQPIKRHKDFRLFACMNPATDVGKKDLPPGIRNRFTEIFVDELKEREDLKVLVSHYLKRTSASPAQINSIVEFYLSIGKEAKGNLTDGTGSKPFYSLRTLCRALDYIARDRNTNLLKSLYEGFCLAFFTQIDRQSRPLVENLIIKHLIGKKQVKSLAKAQIPRPEEKAIKQEGYWVIQGQNAPVLNKEYILTASVRANLKDIARAVAAGRLPILLQGETSVGKTSLVKWLATATGNTCIRINNHEHTDIQEYIGSYTAGCTGKLYFKEGALVQAMRNGQWVILDELNLAPSDVLEALNRLLDDNHELFIPETKETVKAHPHFRLFATQNPAGYYGGRKALSKAFRNRFIELHFDAIPNNELEDILSQRCDMPRTYCKKMIAVMVELQTRRRESSIFAGKQGFITLRDLFRWAERYRKTSLPDTSSFYDWDQFLVEQGYLLLAGRVRKEEEAALIQGVLEKHFKKKIDCDKLFSLDKPTLTTPDIVKKIADVQKGFENIVWTENSRRMAVLIGNAITFDEPILLVGETGCGKTTMCQLFAHARQQSLVTLNCHMHTETADFIGGLRPSRHRSELEEGEEDNVKLFEWSDGPLVRSMKEGSMCLLDEISLAEDSVLERINSVLEPERTLLLAEKSESSDLENVDEIVAELNFRVVATMNPGGDYGKKELSPALRNRFTEIWCPASDSYSDLVTIIEHNIKDGVSLKPGQSDTGFGRSMMDFVTWFSEQVKSSRFVVSIRDMMTWVSFVNQACCASGVSPASAYLHGGSMVFLDRLSSGQLGCNELSSAGDLKFKGAQFLINKMKELTGTGFSMSDLGVFKENEAVTYTISLNTEQSSLTAGDFSLSLGGQLDAKSSYSLNAPTTSVNAMRIMRAMQLSRPVLLEGSPGVGKTSLVSALASACQYRITRINLSEQTDVTDLFGSDLPEEGSSAGKFVWRDGPLLQALKLGHWIMLDEMNLASQSVLEGLNACLDHRGEIFIPEISMTFKVDTSRTKIFACQNPVDEGGGRKSLPKSFLNRFTQVYIEPLNIADQKFIISSSFPQFPPDTVEQIVSFNNKLSKESGPGGKLGLLGGPWEFNLRDALRWCDIVLYNQIQPPFDVSAFIDLIYCQRLRLQTDRENILECWQETIGGSVHKPSSDLLISESRVFVGDCCLERNVRDFPAPDVTDSNLVILHKNLRPLESLMFCVQMNWLSILIGKSGSGKTSLIKSLARLTRNKLEIIPMNSSMDTTDLLGGFEQFDICRDVGVVVQTLKDLVLSCVSDSLTSGGKKNTNAITSSQDLLNLYSLLSGKVAELDPNKTAQCEELYECIVSGLEIIKTSCTKSRNKQLKDAVQHTTNLVNKLQKTVQDHISGKKKGGFEWIESPLVRAMKEGHWALLDNVNFCSPTVLDRLNAVLEPGGTLVINERGVLDGNIPTVTPHPNFRLFMTMNPQFGEISRAMRNRGIEIYLLPQEEDTSDLCDQRALLQSCGVFSEDLLHILCSVHDKILSSHGNSMYELTKAAALVDQYLASGANVRDALVTGIREIYDYDNLGYFDIPGLVDKLLEADGRSISGNAMAVKVSPGIDMYEGSSKLSNSIRVTSLFLNLVSRSLCTLWPTIASKLKSNFPRDLFRCNWPVTMIQSYVKVFLESLSPNDYFLASELIQFTMNKIESTKQSEEILGEIRSIAVCAQKTMDTMKQQQLFQSISCANGDCAKGDKVKWSESLSLANLKKDPSMNRICNMIETISCLVSMETRYVSSVMDSQIPVTRKTDKLSTLSISYFFHTGNLGARELPSSVYADIFPFVELLFETASSVLNDEQEIADSEAQNWREALVKLEGFLQFCSKPMTLNEHCSSVPVLCLQWQWVAEGLLPLISSSADLGVIAERINCVIGIHQKLKHFCDTLLSSNSHPAPPSSNQTVSVVCLLNTLESSVFGMCDDRDQFLQNLSGMLQKQEKIKSKAFQRLTQEGIVDEDDAIDRLINEFQEHSVKHTVEGPENPAPRTPDFPYCSIQLWPVIEYLELLSKFNAFLSTAKSGNCSDEQCDQLTKFCLVKSPGNPDKLYPFHLVGREPQRLAQYYHSCVSALLTIIRRGTCFLNQGFWSKFSETSDFPEEQLPSAMHHPVMLTATSEMMDSPLAESEKTSVIKLSSHQEKINQLREMSTIIWTNMEKLSRPTSQTSVLMKETLVHIYIRVAKTLVTFEEESGHKDAALAELTDLSIGNTAKYTHLKSLGQELKDIEEFIPYVSQAWSNLTEVVFSLSVGDKDGLDRNLRVCEAWMLLGYVQTWMYGLHGPVDPVWQKIYTNQVCQNEIEDIENELFVREAHQAYYFGSDCADNMDVMAPPHLMERIVILQKLIAEQPMSETIRNDPSQYITLRKETTQFSTNFVKFEQLSSVISDIKKIGRRQKRISTKSITEVEARAVQFSKSADSFCKRLNTLYPLYQDLTEPIRCGIRMIECGLTQACAVIKDELKAFGANKVLRNQNLGQLLSEFPVISPDNPAWLSKASEILKVTKQLITDSPDSDLEKLHSRLLDISLGYISDHAATSRVTEPVIFDTLNEAFSVALHLWQQQRDKDSETPDASSRKVQQHGIDMLSDEISEQELKQAFPDYAEDFVEQNTQEEEMEESDNRVESLPLHTDPNRFPDVHVDFYTHFTSLPWYVGNRSTSVPDKNIAKLVCMNQDCLTSLLKAGKLTFSGEYNLESFTHGSSLVVNNCLQCAVCLEDSDAKLKFDLSSNRPYDFYHDANINSAMECYPVLKQIAVKADKIYNEWPDHPTINQLYKVIKRISDLSIRSPIMKLLTGMEMILEKLQEWETNSSREYSLSPEIQTVTELILKWRKEELRCWNTGLSNIEWDVRHEVGKWWYFISNTVYSYLGNQNQQASAEEKVCIDDIVKILHQFMEQSPIGEFRRRLELILAFHCQVSKLKHSEDQEAILNLLWNTYKHYHMFLSNIGEEISRVRAPIEKKIKDYVNIVQWNVHTLFAVKKNITKTHRTLQLCFKQYREALKAPSSQFLTEHGKGNRAEKASSKKSLQKLPKILREVDDLDVELGQEFTLQKRLQTLTTKAHKHSMDIITAGQLSERTQLLETFTSDVIDGVTDLAAREVPQNLKGDERKSWVKQAQVQKRKCLTDLYKQLKSFGLSFRKGMIAKNTEDSNVKKAFSLPPIEVDAALGRLESFPLDTATADSWKGCSSYLIKTVSRLSLLHRALEKPHKELNSYMLDRCSGFSEHLVKLLLEQKFMLCQYFNQYYELRQNMSTMLQVCDKQMIPVSVWCPIKDEIDGFCTRLRQTFQELRLLLSCCPSEESVMSNLSPLWAEQEDAMSSLHKAHPDYLETVQAIESCLTLCNNIQALMDAVERKGHQNISFREVGQEISEIIRDLTGKFQVVETKFSYSCSSQSEKHTGLGVCVASVSKQIQSTSVALSKWMTSTQPVSREDALAPNTDAVSTIENYIQSLLLAVQHVKEFSSTVPHESDLSTNLIPTVVSGSFKPYFNKLDIKSIFNKCSAIQKIICSIDHTTPEYGKTVSLLKRCRSLMDVYCFLTQTILTQYIAAHRATAKFTSVLLGVFIDLAKKGFCTPEDLSEETEEEGQGEGEKFDTGECGLGSGEGQKDVSDQIETEDQLEELQQEGGDEEDDKDVPDENENGIEMTDNFDGKTTDKGGKEEGEEDGSDKEEEDEEDKMENEMGEADGEQADTLDEKMWDSEEEKDEEEGSLKMDDPGKGQREEETEMAAKDQTAGESEQKPMDGKIEEESPEEQDAGDDLEDMGEDQTQDEACPPEIPEQDPAEVCDLPEDLEIDEPGSPPAGDGTEEQPEDGEDEEGDMEGEGAVDPEAGEEAPGDEPDQESHAMENNSPDNAEIPDLQAAEQGPDNADVGAGKDETGAENETDGKSASNELNKIAKSRRPDQVDGESKRDKHTNKTSEDRTTGTKYQPIEMEGEIIDNENNEEEAGKVDESKGADTFEHTKAEDETSVQKLDLATEKQQNEDNIIPEKMEFQDSEEEDCIEKEDPIKDMMDVDPGEDLGSGKSKQTSSVTDNKDQMEWEGDEDMVTTTTVARNPAHSFHGMGALEKVYKTSADEHKVSEPEEHRKKKESVTVESLKAWDFYENSTLGLAQELCEQLRLVLHPTGGKKLKGDFRTGKRLNMRRIIPYIASQFRKDKIWLRRTKPHKRQYQIMMALDNSSSMADNNLNRLAFESVAVVANALNLLQAGQLGVCSFGDTVEMVHEFHEPFSSHSGGNIVQNFSFDQEKTRIAQMLRETLHVFQRSPQSFGSQAPPVSKLLLILSDGRGIFYEGMNTVLSAVRASLEENIFIVFVILDNPANKDSVLDIKVPVFKTGSAIPEITSYMESFPFPHYIILRNVESLPLVFSDAIRQWFEMVTRSEES